MCVQGKWASHNTFLSNCRITSKQLSCRLGVWMEHKLCSTQFANIKMFSYKITLPGGVSIDVAGHKPSSPSVLGSTFGLLEGEVRPITASSSLRFQTTTFKYRSYESLPHM